MNDQCNSIDELGSLYETFNTASADTLSCGCHEPCSGLACFSAKKGTRIHRITGRMFVVALLVTSVSAFFVRGYGNRESCSLFNGFSLINLLVPYTIFMLARALITIRRGDVDAHKWGMISTFAGGIVIAGAFTFLPGRHMHTLFFGDPVEIQQDIQSNRKH